MYLVKSKRKSSFYNNPFFYNKESNYIENLLVSEAVAKAIIAHSIKESISNEISTCVKGISMETLKRCSVKQVNVFGKY